MLFDSIENVFNSKDYVDSWYDWAGKRWYYTIYISIVYVFIIFRLKSFMSNRAKYDLRLWLGLWNLFLSVFSIIGTYKLLPSLVYNLYNNGLDYVLCDKGFTYGSTGFWTVAFGVSKLFELIDTLFIVFRKQPLILLHWYHHATVLIYCFFSTRYFSPSIFIFLTMNYFVHSIMYGYFALKVFRFNISKSVSKMITILQISQMFIGWYISYRYIFVNIKHECLISMENLQFSMIMYFSYIILFSIFYFKTYHFNDKVKQL
jgi:elongation of very long chain fatty acids protein 6